MMLAGFCPGHLYFISLDLPMFGRMAAAPTPASDLAKKARLFITPLSYHSLSKYNKQRTCDIFGRAKPQTWIAEPEPMFRDCYPIVTATILPARLFAAHLVVIKKEIMKSQKTKRSKAKSLWMIVPQGSIETGNGEVPIKTVQGARSPLAPPKDAAACESTQVVAKIDVGIGNSLFIRGNGSGLNWAKGEPLTCIDANLWTWCTNQANETMRFKLLLNDAVWAQGEDLVAEPFSRVEVEPRF